MYVNNSQGEKKENTGTKYHAQFAGFSNEASAAVPENIPSAINRQAYRTEHRARAPEEEDYAQYTYGTP